MTSFVIVLVFLAALVIALAAVVRAVREDGYGTRPAPHPFEDWGSHGVPSLPYANPQFR